MPCLVIQDIRRWRFGKDIPGDAGDVGGCGDCGDVGWDEVKFVEKIELWRRWVRLWVPSWVLFSVSLEHFEAAECLLAGSLWALDLLLADLRKRSPGQVGGSRGSSAPRPAPIYQVCYRQAIDSSRSQQRSLLKGSATKAIPKYSKYWLKAKKKAHPKAASVKNCIDLLFASVVPENDLKWPRCLH